MRNIGLVARNEFLTHIRKPSFYITTLIVPAVAIIATLIFGNVSFGETMMPGELGADETVVEEEEVMPASGMIGYVDRSGIIQQIPPSLAGSLQGYDDSAQAEAALRAGEIDAYYEVPPDYLQSGDVERVARRFEPVAADTATMEFLLTSNLLEEADPTYSFLIRDPLPEALLEHENVGQRTADQVVGQEAEGIAFGLAYVLAMLIYTTTFVAASYLLQSVATEKENRVMELLLTSLRPFELLAGKVLGLGLLGLMQTTFWGIAAYIVVSQGEYFDFSLEALGVDWQLAVMVVLYYLLGYGVYSSMMAAVGALVPSVKESGPATMLVVIPAIIPLAILASLVEQPHSTIALVLSMVPFTAPITMLVRLSQGGVPVWQIVLSVLIMLATVPLLLNLVARLFRAQILLSSESFSPRRAWAVIREG